MSQSAIPLIDQSMTRKLKISLIEETSPEMVQEKEVIICQNTIEVDSEETSPKLNEGEEDCAYQNTLEIDFDLECSVARALYEKSPAVGADVTETSTSDDDCPNSPENELRMGLSESCTGDSKMQGNCSSEENSPKSGKEEEDLANENASEH